MQDIDELVCTLREHAAEVDKTGRFPEDNLKILRACGLMGLLVPSSHGGRGGSLATFVDVAQRLAAGCCTTAMIWAMHCQQVDVLVRHANPSLLEQLLPKIAAGHLYLGSVTTDRAKGGHLLSAGDPARTDGGRLSFVRDAPVVTGGLHADGYLLTLRAGEDAGSHEVSLLYADRGDLTITQTSDWNAMGMRGTESVGLRLEGSVPAANVIGVAGKFNDIAVDSLAVLAHLGWSACWLGAAHGAFAAMVSWMRQKHGRGAPDIGSDLVRERLARIRFDLELGHAYLMRCVDEVETARSAGRDIADSATQIHLNTLKLASSELSFAAVDRMVQLAGMFVGYTTESPVPLERTFRDLRSAALNFSNERLWSTNGGLILLDRKVSLL